MSQASRSRSSASLRALRERATTAPSRRNDRRAGARAGGGSAGHPRRGGPCNHGRPSFAVPSEAALKQALSLLRPDLFAVALPALNSSGASGVGVTGNGSPALTALSARFRVTPISTTSSEELAKVRLLLMAQPQAQTPENLVALDEWMRAGGRLLLLADPLLEWSSTRPLGF